jgi:hypothetical protein
MRLKKPKPPIYGTKPRTGLCDFDAASEKIITAGTGSGKPARIEGTQIGRANW